MNENSRHHAFLVWLKQTHRIEPCQHVGVETLLQQYGAEYNRATVNSVLAGLRQTWGPR